MHVGSRPQQPWSTRSGLYSGSKIPTCVEISNKIKNERKDWFKESKDTERRLKVREIVPNISPGPMSSRDPRLGPSWGIEYRLWWQ